MKRGKLTCGDCKFCHEYDDFDWWCFSTEKGHDIRKPDEGICEDFQPTELRHKDIIRMIRGTEPLYTNEAYKYLESRGLGRYSGGFKDEWNWTNENSECWKISRRELLHIYTKYCEP